MLKLQMHDSGGSRQPVRVGLPPLWGTAIFLPLAGAMGFQDSQMIAILIMAGSPTTVACFIMAKNMKADSVLTANAVLLSTLLSAPSLTFWLYLMRLLRWI